MLSDAEVNEICDLLMELPANEWEGAIEGISSSEIGKVERECDRRSSQYAVISGYLSGRGGSGAGDHGHVEAYKVGLVRGVKVRKALGYSD